MSYQSEAQLEQQLIDQLVNQDYKLIPIADYDSLMNNFKIQFEAFNGSRINEQPFSEKEWERIFNHISGKSIFESAKILRDKFVLERDNGTKIYLSLLDEDFTKNIYQVTNQTTLFSSSSCQTVLTQNILPTAIRIFCILTPFFGLTKIISVLLI